MNNKSTKFYMSIGHQEKIENVNRHSATVLYPNLEYHLSPPLTPHHNLNINAQDLIPITTIAGSVDGIISFRLKL